MKNLKLWPLTFAYLIYISVYASLLVSTQSFAANNVLFEGYSKILSGGVHVGYTIQKYEFDPKTKKFTATTITKTGALGSDVTESLKAVADESLKPISYSYTSLVGKETKTIDATFANNKMKAVVKEGGKTKTILTDLSRPENKGVFLSQFLVYLILKKGLQADSKYEYKAIAEEDAQIYEGKAVVSKQEKYNQFQAYKVFNDYKSSKFVAYISDRGEILGVTNPGQNISTELMAKPSQATAEFGVGSSLLKNLFGEVPKGTENIVSKALLVETLKPADSEKPKEYGVPQGQGIQLKGTAEIKTKPLPAAGGVQSSPQSNSEKAEK